MLHAIRILKMPDRSAISAAPKQGFYFVVVAKKNNEKFITPVLEDEAQIAVAAALEKFVA
jgi:hypothetical protein